MTRAPENVAARQTDYIRDDYGNAITVIEKEFTGEADRQTDTIYDNNGIYPQTITNSKGQDTEVVGGLYQRVVNSGTTDTVEERFALNAAGRKLGEIVREHGGADTTLYFHADHQGSIDTITMDGQVSAKQEFDPFGKPIDALAEPLTRAGFTGHAHDNDLGLVDMKGRIYHPFAARFTTPNPVMQSTYSTQGLNRYNYVFNNPVNNVDPNGRETFVDTIYGFSGKRRLFGYVQSGDHRRFARLVDEPAPDLPEYSVVDATEISGHEYGEGTSFKGNGQAARSSGVRTDFDHLHVDAGAPKLPGAARYPIVHTHVYSSMLSADDIALADRTGIRVVVVGPKSEGAAFIIYEPSTHEMFVVPR